MQNLLLCPQLSSHTVPLGTVWKLIPPQTRESLLLCCDVPHPSRAESGELPWVRTAGGMAEIEWAHIPLPVKDKLSEFLSGR